MSLLDSTGVDGSPLFPPLRRADVLACQTSSWYPTFERKTIKSTIITGLGEDFRAYLESDGLIIPEGAEDRWVIHILWEPKASVYSYFHPIRIPIGDLSSDDEMESDSDDEPMARFSFPELDRQIRQTISAYTAVFPKLNWTAPKVSSTYSRPWLAPLRS